MSDPEFWRQSSHKFVNTIEKEVPDFDEQRY